MMHLLTLHTGAPLLQRQHPLPVQLPGVMLLEMGGGHDIQLPLPVLQLSHQQLQFPPLSLDGGGTAQVTDGKLSQQHTSQLTKDALFWSGLQRCT